MVVIPSALSRGVRRGLYSVRQADGIRVLLIQDNPEYANLLSKRLKQEPGFSPKIQSTQDLKSGLEILNQHQTDVVLLELSLRDSSGLDTFEKIQIQSPMTPVIILTHLDDELIALRAMRQGAQDYLLKGEVEGKMLARIIRYAIERHHMTSRLLNLSIRDDLTGLYNRRGFFILTEQQLKLSMRTRKGLLLFLADLDGLKQINDVHGHMEGDRAIKAAADILCKTFRTSDIVTRIGGDEFAVAAVEAQPSCQPQIVMRLREAIETHNESSRAAYGISLSMGSAYFNPDEPVSVESLLNAADQALYAQKRAQQKA